MVVDVAFNYKNQDLDKEKIPFSCKCIKIFKVSNKTKIIMNLIFYACLLACGRTISISTKDKSNSNLIRHLQRIKDSAHEELLLQVRLSRTNCRFTVTKAMILSLKIATISPMTI